MMTSTKELSILCSVRIRLTAEQRTSLKAAYRERQQRFVPQPTVMPGSSIQVVHSAVNSDVNTQLGLPNVVVVDLLNSREAISLPTIMHFQKELDISVVTRDELVAAFNGYLDHVAGAEQ